MKAVAKLECLLQARIQFLHELLIINAYQQLLQTNLGGIKTKHFEMEKQQTELVQCILRITRIEETFKKQFHRLILVVFNKIEPGIGFHLQPSGTYKQIIDDYSKFFHELKEKDISNLLTEIFQPQIYSQTTVIYVLLELLFKFLRIKCMKLICDKIQPKLQKHKQAYHLQFKTIDKNKQSKQQEKNKLKKKQRNFSAPVNRYSNGSAKYKNEKMNNGKMQFNCLTINQHTSIDFMDRSGQFRQKYRTLKSVSARKNSFQSSHETNEKPRRKVIKSFRQIKQSTQQKIQRNLQELAKESQTSSRYLPNHKKFIIAHKQEWKEYLNLIAIQDVTEGAVDNQNLKIPEVQSSAKKKQWENKNNGKVVSEYCSRNEEIRKYIDIYSEEYNEKYKNQVPFGDRLRI